VDKEKQKEIDRQFKKQRAKELREQFMLSFEGSCTLKIEEIWPDGDAPKNPTVDDVVKRIKEDARSPGELLSEWLLEDHLEMNVTDRSDGPTREIKWP